MSFLLSSHRISGKCRQKCFLKTAEASVQYMHCSVIRCSRKWILIMTEACCTIQFHAVLEWSLPGAVRLTALSRLKCFQAGRTGGPAGKQDLIGFEVEPGDSKCSFCRWRFVGSRI